MVAPADGSWELTVTLTEFQVERVLRVKGDLHIGGLMLKLVESLSESFLFQYSVAYFSNQLIE